MSILLATFTALFSVVNPLGSMPLFVAMTQNSGKNHRNSQALRASIYMAAILITFFLAGTFILDFFGITLDGLRIAGGLIIMKSGLDLLSSKIGRSRGVNKEVQEEAIDREDISFSPLAMPMLAGPGSIALLIGQATELEFNLYNYGMIITAIILVCGVTYGILRAAPALVEKMGKSGISALSRMIGFIVLAIGVQFIANGVTPILKIAFGTH